MVKLNAKLNCLTPGGYLSNHTINLGRIKHEIILENPSL